YGLYVAMALLAIISVPLLIAVVTNLFGRHDFVSVAEIARTILVGVLLPLALGVAIRHYAPAFAARAWSFIYKLSMLLVVIAFAPILIKMWPAMMDMVGNGTLLAMASATIAALIGGHVLGGPDLVDRATLATAASVRHPGISMAIAGANMQDPRVSAA